MDERGWLRDWYERGWGAGGEQALRRHTAENVEDLRHGTTGIDALLSVVRELHRTFPDLTLQVSHQQVSDMLRPFRQLGVIPSDWKADRALR